MATKVIDKTHTMTLIPPPAGACQECATEHPPELPHNWESFYYHTKFKMDHDRSPTWNDAIAHCTEEIKAQWAASFAVTAAEHSDKSIRKRAQDALDQLREDPENKKIVEEVLCARKSQS